MQDIVYVFRGTIQQTKSTTEKNQDYLRLQHRQNHTSLGTSTTSNTTLVTSVVNSKKRLMGETCF